MKKSFYITNLFLFFLGVCYSNNPYIIKLEDFNAVYDDNLDDTNAFRAALNQAISYQVFESNGTSEISGVIIKLSAGTLNFNSLIEIPDINLTIEGAGIDITNLVWTGNGGMQKLNTDLNPPFGYLEVRNLSILTNVPNMVGLKVQEQNSSIMTFIMKNVKISGINGGYWQTCFEGIDIPLTQLTDCEFYGDFNNTLQLVRISAFTVASRFLNCKLSGGQTGYFFKDDMEGIFLINNDITNVGRGIVREPSSINGNQSEPLFDIINNKITAKNSCIDLRGLSSSNISNNRLTIDNQSSTEITYGIYMNGTNIERSLTFSENTFVNIGNFIQSIGFFADGVEGGLAVTNNTFLNFNSGIKLSNCNQVLLGDNIKIDIGNNSTNLYNLANSNNTNLYIKESGTNNSIQCNEVNSCELNIKSINVSGYTVDFIPTNAIDCDPLSRWSVNGLGNYITLELNSNEIIKNVEISFNSGQTRQYFFEILTSNNGINFTSQGNFISNGTTSDYEIFNLPLINAKFVKIITNGNSVNSSNAIKGLKINKNCDTLFTSLTNKNDDSRLVFYPNPISNNKINIEFEPTQDYSKISIYSIRGNELFTKLIHNYAGKKNIIVLEFPDLEDGIYILKVDDMTTKMIKIVKN